ncbi:MAG: putative quinol monooxygenase [Casimicrobiaceae bacterium]
MSKQAPTPYVVTVLFDIAEPFTDRFHEAIRANARDSRTLEAGCLQFDVCVAPENPTRVFLYEVYDDEASFAAHARTEHFRRFDAAVRDWVRGKKVSVYRKVEG